MNERKEGRGGNWLDKKTKRNVYARTNAVEGRVRNNEKIEWERLKVAETETEDCV